MKKLFLLSMIIVMLQGCMDLDSFITPVVFINTPVTEYKLESASAGYQELSSYNAVYPDASIENIDNIVFNGEAGELYAYYLWHNSIPTGKTIFYCHGNKYNMDNYWTRAKLLYQTGCNVFMFDYRGFGRSEGIITEDGFLSDSLFALNYLVNTLAVPQANIILYGYSIGSVAALHAAVAGLMESAAGIILEAPVGSAEIYVQDAVFLSLPGSYITKYKLDNITNIKKIQIPVLLLLATADTTNIYSTHGQAISDNYSGIVLYKVLVVNAEHSTIPSVLGGTNCSVYIQGIEDFCNGIVPFPGLQ